MTTQKHLMAGLVLLAMAGCGQPTSGSRAGLTATQQAACRQRTDEVFLQQNRGAVYQADNYVSGTRDTPFSTSALPGYGSGLGSQYARERALDDCFKSSGSAESLPPAPTITK